MPPTRRTGAYLISETLPAHLAGWQLPPEWRWGTDGVFGEQRHYQEVIDALGRSLSLVTVSDGAHHPWLAAEARLLAHLNHPSIPTTYHYWTATAHKESRRGPGYLRRWIAGETVGARLRRMGAEDVPWVLNMVRATGSALAYVHDSAMTHGALGIENVWVTPTGRIWLLGWEWALAREVPAGLRPDPQWTPSPPEWREGEWKPTTASDQWQLAALCFFALTGEPPPHEDIPPIRLVRPECPADVAEVLDRALSIDPAARHNSVGAMLKAIDRAAPAPLLVVTNETAEAARARESAEQRLRWATQDDYEVLAALGAGTFGSVWRVRDLTLEREVALKMLHPHVAQDLNAVGRFRREARLAAQLAHPGIVPIYDWDQRGDVQWYTMELAEGGSVADLIARAGPRPLGEIVAPVEQLLDALSAAHSVGVIHRDLKPENVLIDRYRRWRITDFGIANVTGEDLAGPSGTPAFAAPEQLLGESQGAAVDCFALAAIVAFVSTGRPPFGDRDFKRILARELAGEMDIEGVEPSITGWLRRGLATDPEQRFDDASEMLEAWREATREQNGGSAWWRRWFGRENEPLPR
jgi:serine/threonine protein kinase